MALRKPSSYFGDNNKPESKSNYQKENSSLSFAGTFDGIIESVYLKIKDLTDEQIEFIKGDVFKIYSLVDNLVEHELPQYKKQSMSTAISFDKKISDVKESLAVALQEHIAETQTTIQEILVEGGFKKHDKAIHSLSTDLKIVERFLNENSRDIISLREEVAEELKKVEKATVNIPFIEKRLKEIKESYEELISSKKVLSEGTLNEPPNTQNGDPLTPLDQNFVTFDQLQKHYQLFINRIQQQMATIGGGGETQLKYLDDIVGIATNASAYDGKFLRYKHDIKKFVFEDALDQAFESQALNSVLGFGNTSLRGMSVGVSTFSGTVIIGSATTALIVDGDARVTGILTIGPASVTIDGINNTVSASSYSGSGAQLTGITTGQIVDFIGFATEGYVNDGMNAVVQYTDNLVAISTFSGDYGDLTNSPTLVSQFSNDVGFVTSSVITGLASEGFVYETLVPVLNYVDTSVAGLASEGYVNNAVAGIVSAAPATLDTLNELSQALADDPNFATTIATAIGEKASLSGATFTGIVTGTTFVGNLTGTASTASLATTSYYLNDQPGSYYLDYLNFSNTPTSLSQFTNDVGFVTSSVIAGLASEGYVNNLVAISTFSGNYNDLINQPSIPSDTGDLTNSVGFVTSSVVDGYATEGYVDNLVAISTFSGNYNDLSNQPSIPSVVGLASEGYVDNLVAISTFSGNYNDLTNQPTIPSIVGLASEGYVDSVAVGFVTSGDLVGYATESYVNNLVAISTFSGDYNDLSNQPTIPSVVGLASEGYVDNLVAISTFSGDYNDLINQPSIPSDTGDLTNSVGFITASLGIPGAGTTGQILSKVSSADYDVHWKNVSQLFSSLPGPYVNEGAAASAGVQVGSAYYDNGGTVRVRLT